ncbi:MAG TPA: class I poly(R)-hydroxyalkanoic acid synthase [Hyphomicrobiaceae bacterium]|nr:class I poly(R)-hydroxyalkanoic acid synthase [Hyphomicrobiaceae bacterium]
MQKHTAVISADPEPYQLSDPEEFSRNMLRLIEDSSKVMASFLERADAVPRPFTAISEFAEANKILAEIAQRWGAEPGKLAEAQARLFNGYVAIWSYTLRRMLGEEAEPVVEPAPGDNRFKDPDWSNNAYFDFWKQFYLLTIQWAQEQLARTEGLDERTRQKAAFYLEHAASALSPSNFPMTNPEVLRETMRTNARNLLAGIKQLMADMERSGDVLKISQTDLSAFEVGKNLAVTPGKVIFRNEIFELIQYAPSTDKVREVPLLIVPPWINKFYILDLTQPKSFIKFAVDQGFTVFVMSWVNPDERLANKTFEDYMREGILSATDAVRRETGVPKINVLGYCVGGTLLAATLAHLAARGDEPYVSATFLAAQVDFSQAGNLLLFIDDAQLKALEEMMAERGYLDGSRMATVFNLLRPRDLIWPYIVNNYLLGKKPFPFDLLYWNQDSTRMPAANHKFYLREFYHENKLAKGQMTLGGTKLDLKKVKLPIYELATREDHIAPAKSVFIGARLFGGPVEFVMAGSGHIAGVINPPDPKRVKYQFWTNPDRADTLEEWIEGAKETPGSWWPHWAEWLAKYSGDWVEPRQPGARLGVIEDAPGSFVKVKS